MSVALNAVVYNEKDRILGLLQHVAGYCDELVVIDQESDDGTDEIARDFGALVISDTCTGWAETSRELAHDHTRSEWIAELDADEVFVNPESLVERTAPDAIRTPRRNFVGGVPWDPDSDDMQMRWFRRGTVHFGSGLHQRIWPVDELKATVATNAYILHTKSQEEYDIDAERYRELRLVREAR